MTSPDDWERIESVFWRALDQEPANRAAFLDEACNGAEDLIAEVQSLIEAHSRAGNSLEAVVRGHAEEFLAREDPSSVPMVRIGPYRIVRPLGRGGIGEVFLAEREDSDLPVQVAVKILKRGMETDDVLRRFRTEREILVALDHPGLAKLFDAGTTDDHRPFLVMEFIDGQRIDDYCREQRLDLRARISLFLQVCRIVHFAHQHLVVHRDLKPANILVTQRGEPKLLDFGIAKVLSPDPGREHPHTTREHQRLLSLGYASPEQIAGGSITTGSDVYSLGVVLHELVTGKRPFDRENGDTVEGDAISTFESPKRPSQVVDPDPDLAIPEELDWIVLKALSPKPSDRYSTVREFGSDLSRFLLDEPVIAHPPTRSYRLRKFCRRNRTQLLVVGSFAILLLASTVVTSILYVAAERSRLQASRRFDQVHELVYSMLFEVDTGLTKIPGATASREALVRKALEYLGELVDESGGDPVLQMELGRAFLKVGDIQGGTHRPNVGDSKGALLSYEQAHDLFREVLTRTPRNDAARVQLVRSKHLIGQQLAIKKEALGLAERHYTTALELAEEWRVQSPRDPERRFLWARCRGRMGQLALRRRNIESAEEELVAAMEVFRSLKSENFDPIRIGEALAASLYDLSRVATGRGDPLRGLGLLREARDSYEALLEQDSDDLVLQRTLSACCSAAAKIQTNVGNLEEAESLARRARELAKGLMDADPRDVGAREDYAERSYTLGWLNQKTGEHSDALVCYEESRRIWAELIEDDATNALRYRKTFRLSTRMAELMFQLGRRGPGRELLDDAIAVSARAREKLGLQFDDELGWHYLKRARIFHKAGLAEAALVACSEACAIAERLDVDGSADPLRKLYIADAYVQYSRCLLAADRRVDGEARLRRAIEALDAYSAKPTASYRVCRQNAHHSLGNLLLERGDKEAAHREYGIALLHAGEVRRVAPADPKLRRIHAKLLYKTAQYQAREEASSGVRDVAMWSAFHQSLSQAQTLLEQVRIQGALDEEGGRILDDLPALLALCNERRTADQ